VILPAEPDTSDEGGQVAYAPSSNKREGTLARINHVLVGDFVLGRTALRYISLVALVIATVIGLGTYISRGWVWDSELSLRPDMVSSLAALMLVSALYARRLIEWAPSVYSILSLVLNITITAILVQALLGGGSGPFLGLAIPYLVAFAIILTWAGIRPLAPVVWALVVIVGFVNLQTVSAAMGLWGYLFIILAAVGVFLQLQPSTKHFLPQLRYEFTGTTAKPAPPRRRRSSETTRN
jgi:hypothetical protein